MHIIHCLRYFLISQQAMSRLFFCPVGENSVITRSSNKKSKVPFRKTKLGIQSISYVGPYTYNSFSGNLLLVTILLRVILRNISLKKSVTLKQTFTVTPN